MSYRNAGCTYPGAARPAVQSLNLEVKSGELLVLVGPSGCGKSTVLRMLAGLEPVTEGTIHIGDVDVTDKAPAQRDVAMVFQNYALYPHMSVAENLDFALRMSKVAPAERARRVLEAARMLDLEPLLQRKPKELSGGQRQRVAMGRAMVREPRVFLLDEPLSNLDAKLRGRTRTELAALQERLRTTMIYVTHDQVEAMTLGHRVAALDAGVLQQCAPPSELYARPANTFVAGFLGSPAMNLQQLPLQEHGVKWGEAVLPLPPEALASARQKGLAEVIVGIRAESFQPSPNGAITLLIDLVEVLGADAFAYGHVAAAGEPTPLVIRTDGRTPPEKGQRLRADVRADEVHLFDPQTRLRLG